MKINYMSDLHLEFEKNSEFWVDLPIMKGEVLILAGDITVKGKNQQMDWVNAQEFDHILYICGNHEYYRGSIDEVHETIRERAADHVHFLQDESITIDGVTFHGTTLWSDFDNGNPMSMLLAQDGMNDYRLIRDNNFDDRFTPNRAAQLHRQSVRYLSENVKAGDVVLTHMAPSWESIHPDFATSRLNGCYASALEWLIELNRPAVWVHGHVHRTWDYNLWDTRVLCNPRGYVGHGEETGFDWDRSFEIK